MTDHYDQNGGHARYMEEQRAKEAASDAQRLAERMRRPVVSEGMTQATNEFKELIAELNAHLDKYPNTFGIKINGKGRLIGTLTTEL